MCMSRQQKTRYKLMLFIISALLIRYFLISPENRIASNFYNGLFGVARNHLPDNIYCNRNCYKIDSAVFKKTNNADWEIKIENNWYPINDFLCDDSVLEKISENDTLSLYRLKPDFHHDAFAHEFEYISADISWDELKSPSYRICNSGIYEHTRLYLPYSYRNESKKNFPPYLHAHSIAYSLRSFFEKEFTKAYPTFLDEYKPGYRVYFDTPLLYIPFPLTEKAYLFSGEVLRDFAEVTKYVHDQNFYAVLAYIPSDIKRIGSIVAYNQNGLLLSLGKKTHKMNIIMKRMNKNKNHYAATVYYRRQSLKKQISEDDYKMILYYSQLAESSYELYDELIFANLRQMLSNFEYNEIKMKLHWPERPDEQRIIEFQPIM